MIGTDIAEEVAAAIAEAGAETGDGAPLRGAIVRLTPADESTYPPAPMAEAEHACTLIFGRYGARDRDGTNITERDVKVMISPDAETDPRNGDKLRVGSETYSLIDVQAVKPGGTVLMWACQARSGE